MTQQYPIHRPLYPAGGSAPQTQSGPGQFGPASGGYGMLSRVGADAGIAKTLVMTARNASGAAVTEGSAVKLDSSVTGALSFTTSTTVDDAGTGGMALRAIPANGQGPVAFAGFVAKARVASGTTAGQYLRQSSTAGVLEGTAAPTEGTLAQALSTRDANGFSQIVMGRYATANKYVRKAADETVNNSDVLQNDDTLLFAGAANDMWYVDMMVRYSASATADFRFDISVPAAATFEGWIQYLSAGAGVTAYVPAANPLTADGQGTGTPLTLLIRGLMVFGANAGNFQFRFAQASVEVSDVKCLTNSFLLARKLA